MTIRLAAGRAVLAISVFAAMSTIPALAGANQAVERLRQNASALLDVVPSAYGCRVELIETIPLRRRDEFRLLVRLRAKGDRCKEAVRLLNSRGESDGLRFVATRRFAAPGDQRLIHQIDP